MLLDVRVLASMEVVEASETGSGAASTPKLKLSKSLEQAHKTSSAKTPDRI